LKKCRRSFICGSTLVSGPLWRGRRHWVGQPCDVGSPYPAPKRLERSMSGLRLTLPTSRQAPKAHTARQRGAGMPSLDTQYTQCGLDASDGPPCASRSQGLPSARALLVSRDIAQAHEHRLERLTNRLTKRSRAVIRRSRGPSSRWAPIPAPCSPSAAASWRFPTIGAGTPRLVSAGRGRATAVDLARSYLRLD